MARPLLFYQGTKTMHCSDASQESEVARFGCSKTESAIRYGLTPDLLILEG
jgi:hypothetical protein